MPDQVIEIPGVGNISFPDSMSQDQINEAAAKLYREKQGALGMSVSAEPNTVGNLVSHVAEQMNPVPVGQALPFPKALGGGGIIDGPVNAVKGVLSAQGVPLDAAKSSYEKGDYGMAAVHLLHYLLPIIGPKLDEAGNHLQKGEYTAGIGDALGLAGAIVGPQAVGRAAGALANTKAASTIADTADAMANRRVVDVIKPTVGANKVRFANMAQDVAPAIARETTGLTREAVGNSIAGKLEDATASLDAAHDARLNARSFSPRPVLDALQAARDKLTAQTVQGSKFTPQSGVNRPALGEDVVPAPNAARVAQIDQAIREVKQLGPVVRYEALRRIRAAYDGPAKAVYSPSMTADFLAKTGEKMGAADVTGAVRGYLSKLDPVTADANASYTLWKKADDVVMAAEETDRARPTVGRTIMARGIGAAAGASAGAAAGGAESGAVGAAVGATLGPLFERGLANLSPAMKLTAARQLASLADAIRAGQSSRATALIQSLRRLIPAASALRDPSLAMAVGQVQGESPAQPAATSTDR